MKLYFATGNPGKVMEFQQRIDERGLDIEVEQVDVDVEEIQELDAEEVAPRKARDSYEKAVEKGLIDEGDPLIVEDTGFHVEALEGFPGTMAKHFAVTVGAEGLIPLMEDVEDRSAYFKSVVAFHDGEKLETFPGVMKGAVPETSRGDAHDHLPYNSMIVPEGEHETVAENPDLKDGRHHRNRAIDSFADWLQS